MIVDNFVNNFLKINRELWPEWARIDYIYI